MQNNIVFIHFIILTLFINKKNNILNSNLNYQYINTTSYFK